MAADFYQECLGTFFHSSFLQLCEVCRTVCWKAAPHHDVPTSKLHCWNDVQCHLSSKQTVFKSWKLPGPLLWTLIFSSFHRFSIGFKSGDWLGHPSFLGCSLSCWNVHPRFIFIILVDGSRFLSRMSRYIFPFILPSIVWSLPVPYAEKQPHTMMFPPPNFTVGMMYSAICPPNMVCIMASKEFKFALIWPDYILPVFHRLVQMSCCKL